MVATPTQTVTVDRISNSGNAIAQQTRDGKTIHVRAGEIGESYEVRLRDEGGYFVAELSNRTQEIQPRQPSISKGPDTSEIGQDLLNPDRNSSYSFDVKQCPAKGKLRGTPSQEKKQSRRSWMTQRKH